MKKHLLAVAVSTAFAAPAMAQNVSVYGILDQSVQSYDNGTTSFTRMNDSPLATSRLGFKGSEDLGGGLKAEFQLESTLGASGGLLGKATAATTTTTTTALTTAQAIAMGSTAAATTYTGSSTSTTTMTNRLFDREAWVGLSGGFGSVRIGNTDLTDAVNIDSKVSFAGDLGLTPRWDGTTGEAGTDSTNVVRYQSPTISGFTFQVGYRTGNSNASVTDGGSSGSGVFVSYEAGPLGVYFGSNNENGATTAEDKMSRAIGAKYDFGNVKVGVATGVADVSTTSNATDFRYGIANAALSLGQGLTGHAIFAQGKQQGSAGKGQGYTLALTKDMSKRTTAYVATTKVTNDAAVQFDMQGVSSVAVGVDPSSFTVGIRHTF